MRTELETRVKSVKWAVRILVGLVVLGMAVAGMSAIAGAHDYLISTSPADGEVLDVAPTEIRLEFSAELQDVAPRIQITKDGAVLVEDDLTLDGQFAYYPVELGPGEYGVEWTVVSSDGHRIEGTFAFTVTAAAAPEPAPQPEPAPEPEPEPAPSTDVPAAPVPSTSDSAVADPATSASAVAAPPSEATTDASDAAPAQPASGPSSWVFWAAILVPLAAGLGIYYFWRKSARNRQQ